MKDGFQDQSLHKDEQTPDSEFQFQAVLIINFVILLYSIQWVRPMDN